VGTAEKKGEGKTEGEEKHGKSEYDLKKGGEKRPSEKK